MPLEYPLLSNSISVDVQKLNEFLEALTKLNPTEVDGISAGAKRLVEVSSGKWQWQEYNGSSWAAVPFLQHNVDQLDGYHAAITPAANTVAVRNASGLLQDSITGNAATASSAATLSETLPVNKGGTGATTSAAARTNLGVPPTSHANMSPTYGMGNDTKYGHLKLSDAVDSASGATGGTAATPAAVKAAKEAADAAQSSADAAMTKASTLATSSTPGIVKPGTGLQIGEEGTMNVVAEQTGCLPLTGGAMTGSISFPYGRIDNDATKKSIYITARTNTQTEDDGAYIWLEAGDTSSANGGGNFAIYTRGNDRKAGPALIGMRDGNFFWNGSETFLPVGSIFAFAANADPSGCLICNGAQVSRTTYAKLFAIIGTIYGAGDGLTTFNIPNMTDRFIQGSGTAGMYIAAGLPDHRHRTVAYGEEGNADLHADYPIKNIGISGATDYKYRLQGQYSEATVGGTSMASAYNYLYGASATVQPPALTMRYYIKY